ncbi:MAG TPA: hypothetical protein VNH83_12290 [Bryobacteraceae bacterium]|jgi:hypothetical protein|nr:hypothetical protein [Bryobacteraceae bacterium]
MPATVLEIARRAFIAALAAPLFADTHQEIIDLFTKMASALSEGNGLSFLDHVDHAMPDYGTLEKYILALAAQDEVMSSIDLLKEEGDDRTQTAELDWFLQIRSREQSGPLERRRQIVRCRLERTKKKWKVMAVEPVSFFVPPGSR